ncbi:MAG TPA: hypothetical protein VFJ74_14175, partial [Gemmatimonadaceae bacterium]|nr:hypothetical protein [Gemmatimonadaceae bacterium]
MNARPLPLVLLLSVVAAAATPRAASGQSLLDRPPNMSGAWTGAPGTLYFHFVHRFSSSGAPERKVTSVPTFLVAAGLPKHLLVGVNYSTNSTLSPRFPNEWELLGRWTPVAEDYGAPLDLGGQVDYNNAARGPDAELSAARHVGPVRLLVAGRALTNPADTGSAMRYAVAGGAVVRLGTYLSLTGDVASMTRRETGERVAWSAGVHFAIPLTPHTVSIQATNTLVTTLQGASRGAKDVRYGFEFTIPLTLRRYFGRRATPAPVAASAPATKDTVAALDSAAIAQRRLAGADSSAARDTAPAPRDTVRVVLPPQPSTPPSAADSSRAPAAAAPTRRAPAVAAAKPAVRTVRTRIKNIGYLQTRLEVVAGTTVEWTNGDPLAHTVTAVDRSFDSGLIQP